MPARNQFEDIDRLKNITTNNVEMLMTMHAGLSEIAKCEVSLDGGTAMRYIAEKSLERVQEIAAKMEVVNA